MMNKSVLILLVAIGCFFGSCSRDARQTIEQRSEHISRAEMRGIAEMLGHDLLEGRAPGTLGGDLAEAYMNSLFQFMDLQPGQGDSYFQPFVMQGFSNSGFKMSAGGTSLEYISDVVGTFTVVE